MEILITGISSEIMLSFVSLIDLSIHRVTGISRNSILPISQEISIIEGDLMEIDNIIPKLKNYDVIIHAAAVTHSKSDKEYLKVNLEATQKLVMFAHHSGVKNFIFISSNTAGMNNGMYSKTKFLAEEYIRNNLHNWLIFKISEVFGLSNNNGIDQYINQSLKNPMVFCPARIPDKFYPIYVKDAARIMYANSFENEIQNETININGGIGYSFIEMIDLIKSVTNRKIKVLLIPRWIMFLTLHFLKLFPFISIIAPDQIQRLYAKRSHSKTVDITYSLEDYIRDRIN
jgi:nucleoside-diphosphate-sugar epimerase